jgi:hypothetical protein
MATVAQELEAAKTLSMRRVYAGSLMEKLGQVIESLTMRHPAHQCSHPMSATEALVALAHSGKLDGEIDSWVEENQRILAMLNWKVTGLYKILDVLSHVYFSNRTQERLSRGGRIWTEAERQANATRTSDL